MRIFLTGAQGYLGTLFSTSLQAQHQLVLTSRTGDPTSEIKTLDVMNRDAVFEQIRAAKPDIIIHTAAMANLAKCEAEPDMAIAVNAIGTLNVVHAANEVGAQVLFISSLAAGNPALVYGRSKLLAEAHVQCTRAGFEILKLSMTFGLSPNTSSHRPFNKILDCALTWTPQVFDNRWRFQPTYTEHLLDVLHCLLAYPFQGRLLAVTVDKDCTMYGLACDLLGSTLARPGILYQDREDITIDPDHLAKYGLPTMSYNTMLERMQDQLAAHLAIRKTVVST